MSKLEELKGRAGGLANLCPDYMYRGIRHLQRNCDVICQAEEEDEDHVCNQPDRYVGEDIAVVLAAAPKLLTALEAVDELAKAWQQTPKQPDTFDAVLHHASIKIQAAITEALA